MGISDWSSDVCSSDLSGFMGWITGLVLGRAGAAVPSANRITLLRDSDGDGAAETRTVFLDDLNSPFGMALVGEDLYVANTDAVMRFPRSEEHTSELQSIMRISYADFCLKKKKK